MELPGQELKTGIGHFSLVSFPGPPGKLAWEKASSYLAKDESAACSHFYVFSLQLMMKPQLQLATLRCHQQLQPEMMRFQQQLQTFQQQLVARQCKASLLTLEVANQKKINQAVTHSLFAAGTFIIVGAVAAVVVILVVVTTVVVCGIRIFYCKNKKMRG